MRYVFENKEEAKNTGSILKDYIKNNFTWEHVADKFVEEIERI